MRRAGSIVMPDEHHAEREEVFLLCRAKAYPLRMNDAAITSHETGANTGLVERTLLAVARQRPGFDEKRCRLALDCLVTGQAVRGALQTCLHQSGLSELRFAVLVILFALEPNATTAADLASHAGVTRSSITEALDGLQAHNFIRRQRDSVDRRAIYVRLTKAGRALAEEALLAYLHTATQVTRFVTPTELDMAFALGAQLRGGVELPLE